MSSQQHYKKRSKLYQALVVLGFFAAIAIVWACSSRQGDAPAERVGTSQQAIQFTTTGGGGLVMGVTYYCDAGIIMGVSCADANIYGADWHAAALESLSAYHSTNPIVSVSFNETEQTDGTNTWYVTSYSYINPGTGTIGSNTINIFGPHTGYSSGLAQCPSGVALSGACVPAPAQSQPTALTSLAPLVSRSTVPASTPMAAKCNGMCAPDANMMLASLVLNDTPVGYQPQRGPAAYVRLTYNHAEANQPSSPTFFNVGAKWTLNVLSYIQDNPTTPGSQVMRFVTGGGEVDYSHEAGTFNTSTGAWGAELQGQAVLTRHPASTSVTSYTLLFPDGTLETFSQLDGASAYPRRVFLSSITDPQGNAVTFTYGTATGDAGVTCPGSGCLQLTSFTDAAGRNTSFTYGNSTYPLMVTKITDPFGRYATLAYDGSGRLSSITDVVGITSSFTYDSGTGSDPTFITTLTTPYGNSSFTGGMNYDTNSRWLEITDAQGLTERVEFDALVPTSTIAASETTIPSGMTVENGTYNLYNTFFWNKHELPIARPGGPGTAIDYTKASITHWLQNAQGQTAPIASSTKAALENRVYYNYPNQPSAALTQVGTLDQPIAMGRKLDDGSAQISQATYNVNGLPTSLTDPLGRVTNLTYASNNIDLTQVQQKVTSTPTYSTIAAYGSYNSLHEVLTRTDAAGQVWRYCYNTAGQLTQAIDPANYVSGSACGSYGSVGTRYTIDSTGRVSSVTNALGNTQVSYTYPSTCSTTGLVNCDLPTTAKDSEGWAVSYTRDSLDRTTVATYPDSTTDTYTYTYLDMTSYVDRFGRATSYAYDHNRRVTSTTDHLGKTVTFGYFEDGQIGAMGDENGNVTAWGIDLQGRPTVHQRVADGSTEITSYENTTSRPYSVSDSRSQAKTFSYDKANELTGITYIALADAGVPATPNVTFAYDTYFPRRTSMTDGTGTRNYTYVAPGTNGALQLTQESGPFTNDTIAYAYDTDGRLYTRTVAGDAETFVYDGIGRVSGYNTTLGDFVYTFLGNTNQVTAKSVTGTGVTTGAIASSYSYYALPFDHRQYFISNVGGGARSFLFPNNPYQIVVGQDIPAPTHPWPTTQNWTWSYDSNDRVTSAAGSISGTFNYGYDNAGNPTNFGGSTFGYNGANELTSAPGRTMSYDAVGNTMGDGTHTYTYDGENRTVAATSGTTFSDQTVYDGLGRAIKSTESIGGGSPGSSYFLWCGNVICQWRDSSNNVLARYYDAGYGTEGEYTAGTRYFYLKDQLGSVRDVATGNGTLVYSADYSPYGTTIRATGSIAPRFTFAGLYQVGNIGMLHSRTRDYDPSTGRWLSRDPIKEQGSGPNLYAYAGGNPIGNNDPSGEIVPAIAAWLLANAVEASIAGAALMETGLAVATQTAIPNLASEGAALASQAPKAAGEVCEAVSGLLAAQGTPNAGGVIRSFVQDADQVYYRVFSESSQGSFLTAIAPRSSDYARQALALPPGNAATFVQEVLVPAGTRLQRSRALSVERFGPQATGGGEQFQLLDSIPSTSFRQGTPLK